jgi:hypothetical protein
VAVLVSVSEAPGITERLGSVTLPKMVEVVRWESKSPAESNRKRKDLMDEVRVAVGDFSGVTTG